MKISGHSFYQHSIFSALMTGDLYGSITYKELLKHGNFGLGTFHGADGELVLLDGQAYQILSLGKINLVQEGMTSPFATLTHFVSDLKLEFDNISFKELEQQVVAKFPSLNIFYAIKMTGIFANISMRTLTKQEEPFVSLKEAAKDQEEWTLKDVSGTLVAFWTPKFANSILVEGFHAHFISSDRKSGGHVFDFQAKNLDVEISFLTNMNLHLATTPSYLTHQQIISSSLQEDIKAVESQSKSSS